MLNKVIVLPAISGLLFSAAPALAADFYADPNAGSSAGDGSQANPWGALEEVIAAGEFGTTIQAGDTLWLRSGYHGAAVIEGDNATAVTIAAEVGQTPQLSRARFQDASAWVLRGVSISPSHAPSYEPSNIVEVNDGSSDITIDGCDIFSVDDASAWGAAEWINEASSGIQIGGDGIVVQSNRVRNVRFGISVDGPNALIDRNEVVNFSADGLRGLGDYDVFQYNVVKNIYVGDGDGDDNHDDGFQSWSVGADGVGTGEVTGVVLRGNLIISTEDPNQPLRASMQGIGCFDGFFVDWVVENNVVITDHWHGITLLGAQNSRIVNNTVIDVDDQSPGPPWISVGPHKTLGDSSGILIRNNLATDFSIDVPEVELTNDHNFEITDLTALFVDPANFDLHLLPDATDAVDVASADMAPALDRDRIARPQGMGFDLGAYEWHDPSIMPEGGAPGSGGSDGGSVGSGGSPAGSAGSSPSSGGSGIASGGASSGGSGPGTGGNVDAVVNTNDDDSGEEGGCGCRTAPGTGAEQGWALVLALGLVRRLRGRRT